MLKEFGLAWQCSKLGGLASKVRLSPAGDGTYFVDCLQCGSQLLHLEIAELEFSDIFTVCDHFFASRKGVFVC